MKLPITANPDDTATIQTTNTEVPTITEPMLDYIVDDDDASNSTKEEQNTEETVLIPVPRMDFSRCAVEDKSLHHQCTYSDCQVTGSIFFDKPSEKFNTKTCTHQLHHVYNVNYA